MGALERTAACSSRSKTRACRCFSSFGLTGQLLWAGKWATKLGSSLLGSCFLMLLMRHLQPSSVQVSPVALCVLRWWSGVHSHMGPLCFEERSKCKPHSFPGHTITKGEKEMLILKKSKHVTSAGVTAELYVPWHLLSSWAFRRGGCWWCAEMCGAQLSLLRRPEITSVTFTPQVLP